jgi:hypothetical protein
MATKRKVSRGSVAAVDRRWGRLQVETNRRLGSIEQTLSTASKVLVHMDDRLEKLELGHQALVEGQNALVAGHNALVAGQNVVVGRVDLVVGRLDLVVDRLDRLVDATTRDRTHWIERLSRLEDRVERPER